MGDFSAGQQLSDNLEQGVLGQAGGWDGNVPRSALCCRGSCVTLPAEKMNKDNRVCSVDQILTSDAIV